MACMEHECEKCKETQFNNNTTASHPCKNCGGRVFYGFHDEGGGTGRKYVNIHTCSKCKKEHYNGADQPFKPCDCGNDEFDSLIGDAVGTVKTKSYN